MGFVIFFLSVFFFLLFLEKEKSFKYQKSPLLPLYKDAIKSRHSPNPTAPTQTSKRERRKKNRVKSLIADIFHSHFIFRTSLWW